MSQVQVTAVATCSVSGSGMATVGGYVASRSAIDSATTLIQRVPEAPVSGTFLRFGSKKPFFPPRDSERLLQVDGCALSGETVSFEYSVSRT
jgi:hypothetical protein